MRPTDDFVEVREVGPRDGLQGLPGQSIRTDRRVELIRRLAGCGLARIEAGSFVSERAVPQMAGTDEVMAGTANVGASIEVLVVNERGATSAVACGGSGILVVVAATDSFSQRNVRTSREEALTAARRIASHAAAAGRTSIANIAVAFGCPDEGRVPASQVADIARRLIDDGFEQIYLSDTIGVAGPKEVSAVVEAIADVLPLPSVGLHLHDTRGLGLVNALAGIEAGVRRFDASVGGIGGCPFAPGASGNVATEDLAHLLDVVGIRTGLDLDGLVATSNWLRDELNVETPAHVSRARPWSAGGQ